ncbi:hypothetical protein ACFQL8_19390 [Streptomyces goshikiensis]|uniref:hypothetical protein n=1 Tax=Streptomyces goshikiensis TaxID=1942 RepID=UPI00167B04FA|nr:hypothetical protein [Streptomyces goshikiensis]GHD79433.1 hypothetical protein GCM10010336_61470 [Streptomyces goshikiensis]
MSIRSFIARPTEAGYQGIYVLRDGTPSSLLPLLLAAYRYTFARDLDSMTRHLIDDVSICWKELGTDLLDDVPEDLVVALTGGDSWPSTQPSNLTAPDGSPPRRITAEAGATGDAEWGYVLHPDGIEVISLYEQSRGPVVGWATDPRTAFSDHPAMWPVTTAGPNQPSGTAPKTFTTVPTPSAPVTPRVARR